MTSLSVNFTPNSSSIYLCYFDPSINSLREVTDISILMKPYEESIRRFYIISTSGDLTSFYTTKVSLEGAKKYSYVCKVLNGRDNPGSNSFTLASNTHSVSKMQCEKYYDNAIPVDIYLKSLNKTESIISLEISILMNSD